MKLLKCFLAAVLLPVLCFAQHATVPHQLHLNNSTVTTQPNAIAWADSVINTNTTAPQLTIIQFQKLPTQQEKAALAANGIQLLDYIPDNAYTAIIHKNAIKGVRDNANTFYSITPFKPEWKGSNFLWQQISERAGSMVEVLVSFHKGISTDEIKRFLQANNATIDESLIQQFGRYKIIVDADKVKAMVSWYGVSSVSPVSPIVPLDLEARPAVKANFATLSVARGGRGLNGDSVCVGIGDNASGIYHIDLKQRITNYNPAVISHHGEHVNGLVGGAAIIDPLAEGMAPRVSLVDHLYDNVLFSTPVMYSDHNMTITNNSYEVIEDNCGYSGTYDGYSQMLDQLSLDYPNVLHVFAAGNDGYLNCAPLPLGYGTIGGGYQPAKNDVVVTSMTDFLGHAPDGSRGPVKDGRLKPDITGVGLGQYSTFDVDGYGWAAGTSMAAPQVAGGIALLTQRYKQLHSNTQPRADLLKAILLNGAMDLGNPGPDYNFGFGAMDIGRSLQIIDSNRYTTNTINNGQTQTFSITVPANTAQLKVMLCWHDVPASAAVAHQLVNDLDLTVRDVSGNTHLPLVPDSTTANITSNATEKADHLNNVEQVTINNPTAGTYTVNVNGYNVPSDTQHYVIAYDIIPVGIELTYPTAGERYDNTDSMRIFWNASNDVNTFKVEFSKDNGTNWTVIGNNIGADQRYYPFLDTTINSGNCLVRVTRNNTGQQSVSGRFNINTHPLVQLDTAQCPGYISYHWAPVPNASAYEVYMKKGLGMVVVDTVTDTAYTFSGLCVDSTYYVSAGPIINGASGYRGVAVKRQPNTGNCNNNVSTGDLMAERIVLPNSGRALTSTQLTNNSVLSVKVRNLYQQACSSYALYYSVDGGAWQSFSSVKPIPANNFVIDSVSGIDLSTPGVYNIKVAVHNLSLTDPVALNDTAAKFIINLTNAPIAITPPFIDGFESMPQLTVTHDTMGISPNQHWDFSGITDTGRLRSFVNDSITITGSRSVSMDATMNTVPGKQNYFTGTFNMSNYNPADTEVRLEFDYILHGTPKQSAGNEVWVRGVDTQPWLSLYKYDTTVIPGTVVHSGSLSVSDAMLHNLQNLSSSFQVRFGQNDTSLIAMRNFGNGVTLDNFKLYTVKNDVAVTAIVMPANTDCGLTTNVPVIVKVYNGVTQPQSNVRMFYQYDNNGIVTDTLASINGKDTLSFLFHKTIDTVTNGVHNLRVWLIANGDTYHNNDSILNYQFHNEPLIASYPYLEDFENGNGYWYSGGINNSWQFGTPASVKLKRAASGHNAWKTNLTGYYYNNGMSYLYSPCFDISQLTHPMLSFSAAMDIENCGNTLCDGGYIEYSYDGLNWTKLGNAGQGTNWYDSTFNIWNEENNLRWHVASIPLPASSQPIRFRFVLASDPGATFEGMAIDDVHIFDLVHPIYNNQQQSVSNTLTANTFTPFVSGQKILSDINAAQIVNLTTTIYKHDTLYNPGQTQYIFDRNYTVENNSLNNISATVRLFITDSEILQVINDTTCPSCSKPSDAYILGITKFDSRMKQLENGSLADNTNGSYTYYPYTSVKWVPYDNGYYAQINTNSFSEFWFNDGGVMGNLPVNDDYLVFNAARVSNNQASVYWTSTVDTSVVKYDVQRSANDSLFTTIQTVTALHQDTANYNTTDTNTVLPVTYYRLHVTLNDGRTFYSVVREVDWNNNAANSIISVYPNPVTNGSIYIKWIATQGTVMKLDMLSADGRKVFATDVIATQWNNTSQIHLLHYSPGVYFLKLQVGDTRYTKKLVLE